MGTLVVVRVVVTLKFVTPGSVRAFDCSLHLRLLFFSSGISPILGCIHSVFVFRGLQTPRSERESKLMGKARILSGKCFVIRIVLARNSVLRLWVTRFRALTGRRAFILSRLQTTDISMAPLCSECCSTLGRICFR